uniref:RING-type domain-containing protein n=1 Tax=Globodera pallida TaxID=36090 RepID=A0A183CJL0_GLOPA
MGKRKLSRTAHNVTPVQKRWKKREEKRASSSNAAKIRWAKKRSDNEEATEQETPTGAEPPTELQHTECVQRINELTRQLKEKEQLLAQSEANARSMEKTIEEMEARNAALKMELQRSKEEAEQLRKTVGDRQKAQQHHWIAIEAELANLESEVLQTQLDCLKKAAAAPGNSRKSFSEITPRSQRRVVRKVLGSIIGSPNTKQLVQEAVANKLSPGPPRSRRNSSGCRLTPDQDLRLCSSVGLTINQRKRLKTELGRRQLDILATTDAAAGNKTHVLSVLDPTEALSARIRRLLASEQLQFWHGDERLLICIVGDAGGGWTKLGALIGNVKRTPGSPKNFLLLGCFKGADSAKNLRFAFNDICRDLMFLSHIYGHRGPCSVAPCVFCEANSMSRQSEHTLRPLEKVKTDAAKFQSEELAGVRENLRSRQCAAMEFCPLLDIEMEAVVPPSLHIVMGNFDRLLEKLRQLCAIHGNCYVDQLEQRLEMLGAYKSRWFQQYNGNEIRNALRGTGPEHITTHCLPPSPRRDAICRALKLLSRLQGFAEARMLEQPEIEELVSTAEEYRATIVQNFPDICTPKFHILTAHVPTFVKRHGWWGLLSEQPMESFHPEFNDDIERRSNTRDVAAQLLFCAKEAAIRNGVFDSGF